ncbi:hypothetical protein D9M71_610290 [compost metagenome]
MLAIGGGVGLGRHDLAADVIQAAGGFLADLGEAFLGGDQLLLHQQQLLMTPPGHPAEGDGHGADQRPQRPGVAAALHYRDWPAIGLDDPPREVAELAAVGGIGGKTGHIVEFV